MVAGDNFSAYFKVLQTVNHSATTMSRIRLSVPYYGHQNTSKWVEDPLGFSSVCAMAAEFLNPGCLVGKGERDDRYLSLALNQGNPINLATQVAVLRRLKIMATLHEFGNIASLTALIAKGIPVPIYWLHGGPVQAPTGGRWTLVVGWEGATNQVIMHDPMGIADLERGGFISSAIGDGRFARYKRGKLGSRWMVDHNGLYKAGAGRYLKLAKF